MSERSRVSDGGGVGILSILLIVFLVLKLTGNITWAWIWVLSPLWISFLLAVIIIGIGWVAFMMKVPSNSKWKKIEKQLKAQNKQNKQKEE